MSRARLDAQAIRRTNYFGTILLSRWLSKLTPGDIFFSIRPVAISPADFHRKAKKFNLMGKMVASFH